VIILVAIAIGAGAFVYNFILNTAVILGAQLNIQVISVEIVKTSSQVLVSATIKNAGNVPITSCTVTVYGDAGTATLDLGPIDVGHSKSALITKPPGFSVIIGKSYLVKITAVGSSGTLEKLLTVACSGTP